jgi:hypothetical protein
MSLEARSSPPLTAAAYFSVVVIGVDAEAGTGGVCDGFAMACENHEGIPATGVAAVDLYWLPLGAGGHSVRMNGRVFEAVAARLQHRRACDLYHSALVVNLPAGRFVIEQAPVPDARGAERGVVVEGPVGARWAGRARIFRYEVRRWRDGVIPDIAEAVESPQRLTDDPSVAQRLWECVADLPTPVWGRDEFGTGEMWNSNSVISWLITRSGLPIEAIRPPSGGRAPGWYAGIIVASRPAQFRAADQARHGRAGGGRNGASSTPTQRWAASAGRTGSDGDVHDVDSGVASDEVRGAPTLFIDGVHHLGGHDQASLLEARAESA